VVAGKHYGTSHNKVILQLSLRKGRRNGAGMMLAAACDDVVVGALHRSLLIGRGSKPIQHVHQVHVPPFSHSLTACCWVAHAANFAGWSLSGAGRGRSAV
jgi:hypothetical protein